MQTIELSRDCEAIQIPDGTKATLGKGAVVDITQTLGGTYTVRAGTGLYRIGAQDADALGFNKPESATAMDGPVTSEAVTEVLKTCFDPEIPVNIVDLGLVYDTVVEEIDGGGSRVQVKMTLTAPGCGMGPTIAADAQGKILQLGGVEEADVEVVWDPPWHQSMITEEGRKVLGL
ncbi:MAG: putative Fe-S cluster assembly protein SufT [Verrucomicrobiales bacterium]|nr:putative Fe-S cluster assembly protein SufT [Verrucomicrobiales bacterium]|tara:strand:- start:139 stop:663 length:525 start_codon:yes stop_codon:yes gene_type:complete